MRRSMQRLVLTAVAIVSFCLCEPAQAERLSGSSSQATHEFKLPAGPYVFTVTYGGMEGNFIVTMLGKSGYRDLVINEIGRTKGKFFCSVPYDDYYVLNVKAEGSWWIEVNPPEKGFSRRSFSGRGPDVTPIIELSKGLYVFKMKHKGVSNFIVQAWDETGQAHETLANEIGNFDGSQALQLGGGKYLIEIKADGDWEVNVQPSN